MDTLHAKAEWERVGERWFRKTQQYTSVFDESLDLDNYIVAGAPYGGALGMLPCSYASIEAFCLAQDEFFLILPKLADFWPLILQRCGLMRLNSRPIGPVSRPSRL